MKTTEHFKLQMWVPAHNIMCHFLHLPAQHWHYPSTLIALLKVRVVSAAGVASQTDRLTSSLITTSLSSPSHQESYVWKDWT